MFIVVTQVIIHFDGDCYFTKKYKMVLVINEKHRHYLCVVPIQQTMSKFFQFLKYAYFSIFNS